MEEPDVSAAKVNAVKAGILGMKGERGELPLIGIVPKVGDS